jgi:hypothetical protein
MFYVIGFLSCSPWLVFGADSGCPTLIAVNTSLPITTTWCLKTGRAYQLYHLLFLNEMAYRIEACCCRISTFAELLCHFQGNRIGRVFRGVFEDIEVVFSSSSQHLFVCRFVMPLPYNSERKKIVKQYSNKAIVNSILGTDVALA